MCVQVEHLCRCELRLSSVIVSQDQVLVQVQQALTHSGSRLALPGELQSTSVCVTHYNIIYWLHTTVTLEQAIHQSV